MNQRIEERNQRTKWYQESRFGMFIHWGLYAIPARGEWVRSVERIPVEEYDKLQHEFSAEEYDPKKWAKLAKQAGMKYAVLTAKHHDGFCLFDSQYTDFKSTNTPCGRDLVAEFLEAFRAEGIKVGLYFSIIDWHHPDFPHYGDKQHPMRDNEEFKGKEHNFDNYLTYMHAQARELLTNYGKLDVMWFDFSYNDMQGEKWRATEFMQMVRELQPHIITDNRLEGSGEESGSILTANPTIYAGDFASPEQMIPPKGIVNELGDPVPWEACVTLNNNWGYAAEDKHYKSAKMIVHMLVDCVSKNGNLLLNVGPDAKGRIPEESVVILEEVGKWMSENANSIYGCGMAEFEKPEWGRYTQNGKKLYAHVFEEQTGAVCLSNLANQIDKMRFLKDGSEIRSAEYWNLKEYPDHAFFFLNSKTADSYPLPEEKDTVVEITLK
ncbi:alpha-L-fucosidase [Scatolibacter rhodanostii]|uniref:alpha-L-fucosidase n=1 Tax=Scatolibacter rhodanostii TaxID=2014781 RepID=UPI000C08711C|nr:alpha-L-fucosidase [Scatolibacter rhodanostii]